MANLTIVLDDEVEKRLRLRAAQLYGTRKGALSASIQKAIENWLRTPEASKSREDRVFRAYRNRKVVVEARSLRDLVAKLQDADIDPRRVEIRSSEPIKKTVHIGMRPRLH